MFVYVYYYVLFIDMLMRLHCCSNKKSALLSMEFAILREKQLQQDS